jgi:hypothetical protein
LFSFVDTDLGLSATFGNDGNVPAAAELAVPVGVVVPDAGRKP